MNMIEMNMNYDYDDYEYESVLKDVITSGDMEDLRELDTTGSSANLSMNMMLEEEMTERDSVTRQLSGTDSGSPALGAVKKKVDGPEW